MRWVVLTTMALLPLACADTVRGQVGLESVKRGKKATALVELNGVAGSAFCVDAEGLFLTDPTMSSNPRPRVRNAAGAARRRSGPEGVASKGSAN